MTSVTEAELLQQVREALDAPSTEDGAMSVVELSEGLDMPESAVRQRLKKMIAEGTAEPVRVRRMAMHGVVSRRIAYRIIKNADNDS
jgi:predicted ArsR family transcriptional regulator